MIKSIKKQAISKILIWEILCIRNNSICKYFQYFIFKINKYIYKYFEYFILKNLGISFSRKIFFSV